MKIGIVAGSDTNLYASTTILRLAAQGNVPAVVILAEESRFRRVSHQLRTGGVRATLRKIVRHFDLGGLPDRDARFYLRAYAAERNLADWDCPLSLLAGRLGFELRRVSSLNAPIAAQCVRDHAADLLINTAGVIFRPPLLAAPRIGMLNAHMARLPRFRGMNVLEWSVWAGEPPAVTIHFVTSGIDLGDILAVREIPVTRDDTISTLRARSYAVMVEAMAESVAALHEGRETRTPQQPSEGRQYFAMHPELLRIAEQRLARRKTAARS